jgi:hypothetical protein
LKLAANPGLILPDDLAGPWRIVVHGKLEHFWKPVRGLNLDADTTLRNIADGARNGALSEKKLSGFENSGPWIFAAIVHGGTAYRAILRPAVFPKI